MGSVAVGKEEPDLHSTVRSCRIHAAVGAANMALHLAKK